jgi:RNase P subunit RPR2
MPADSPPMTGAPLVACSLCDAVVDAGNARQRTVKTPQGDKTIWVCKSCLHLGSEEQTRKYIMKEQKIVGR